MKNIKSFQEYNQDQLNEGFLSKSLIAGLQGPDFKSTRCGISKAGAKDAKKRMV